MNQYYTEKQQTQYVDDAMRKARVQVRKAQQTDGTVPSVKGIRESVSQPTVSATPSTPSTPSVQTTTSVPTVRPSSVTSPALTTPNAAADVPLSTPKPTVSKTYTTNVQSANTDILNANKQKATADVWDTDPAPAASPLQTAAPVKAAVAKMKQTDYTKTNAGGILKPQAPFLTTDVPISTAPVSNRTALFGAKDTPDLTLTGKKLEQMGDLYREFSPQQRALLDDYYKNDPASLNVIKGLTTGNDWLPAQSRAAQQREQTRVEIAAQRKAQTARQLALDPTVQADARRSGEILITPGAVKAVTSNTQYREISPKTPANNVKEDIISQFLDWVTSTKRAERELVPTLGLKSTAVGYTASKSAKAVRAKMYGNNSVDGDKANAFQHAYWNALMAYQMGIDDALAWSTAHEKLYNTMDLNKLVDDRYTFRQHCDMDMFNNQLGAEIGQSIRRMSEDDISAVLMHLLGSQAEIEKAQNYYGVSEAELYLAIRVRQAIDEGRGVILIDPPKDSV